MNRLRVSLLVIGFLTLLVLVYSMVFKPQPGRFVQLRDGPYVLDTATGRICNPLLSVEEASDLRSWLNQLEEGAPTVRAWLEQTAPQGDIFDEIAPNKAKPLDVDSFMAQRERIRTEIEMTKARLRFPPCPELGQW